MLLLVPCPYNQSGNVVFIDNLAYLLEADWTFWVSHQFLKFLINFPLLEYTFITSSNPLNKIQLHLKTLIRRSSHFSIAFLLGFDHLQKILDMSRATHFKKRFKLYLMPIFILDLRVILDIGVMNDRYELLVDGKS